MYGIVQNAALAKANGFAVESLGSMRTVHANTAEVGEARRFAKQINMFLRVVLVTVWTQTVVIFTQLGLSKLRDVLVLGFGMWEVLNGRLTIGSYTAFSTYVSLYEQGALIHMSVKMSVHMSICISTHMSRHRSTHMSIHIYTQSMQFCAMFSPMASII